MSPFWLYSFYQQWHGGLWSKWIKKNVFFLSARKHIAVAKDFNLLCPFFLLLFECNEIYNRLNIENCSCITEVYGLNDDFLSSRAQTLIISSALEEINHLKRIQVKCSIFATSIFNAFVYRKHEALLAFMMCSKIYWKSQAVGMNIAKLMKTMNAACVVCGNCAFFLGSRRDDSWWIFLLFSAFIACLSFFVCPFRLFFFPYL